MRSIVAAIALVFALGAVMPTEADARTPWKVEKWGCLVRALDVRYDQDLNRVIGAGVVYGCDKGMRLNVMVSIHEDIPGAPNRMLTSMRKTGYRGYYANVLYLEGATCVPGGPPPAHPFYLRMEVRRMGKPGAVWVATRNVRNPCPQGSSPGTDWVPPA
jgi:hypothetical protein